MVIERTIHLSAVAIYDNTLVVILFRQYTGYHSLPATYNTKYKTGVTIHTEELAATALFITPSNPSTPTPLQYISKYP
jgi:hypothetical protein